MDALACGHNVTAGKGGVRALTLLSMPVQSQLTGHSGLVTGKSVYQELDSLVRAVIIGTGGSGTE